MTTLTIIHTALSIIALVLGFFAMADLFSPLASRRWTESFLAFAVATSVTGYFFPFVGITPAMIVGAVALASLAAVLVGRYQFHLAGPWRWIYASGIVLNAYLLVFVTIVQAFNKIGVLAEAAPTLSEPPFQMAQGAALVIFLVLGVLASRKFRPALA